MPPGKESNPIIFFPLTARSAQYSFPSLLQPPLQIREKIKSLIKALGEKKLELGLTAVALTAGVVAYEEIKKRRGPYDFNIPKFTVEELEKYREMVEMNWRLIYNYAFFRLSSEEEAEDITSQTFIRGAGRFRQFIPLDGLGENPYSPWLYKIASNLIRNSRRKKRREIAESELASDHVEHYLDANLFITSEPNPEEALIAKQELESLQAALDKLPERYQLVLYLTLDNALTDADIGKMLGISEGAVKSLIHRARKALKKIT